MQIIIARNYQDMSKRAARVIAEQLKRKPQSTLGLATGGTPVGLYQELVRLHREGNLDFDQATSFNLDEYVGLSADHPCSYHFFMRQHLFDHVNLPVANIHIPNGLATDLSQECRDYEAAIASMGPIDIQVLGIGHNGHIGFNEPGTSFASRTHVVQLSHSTIAANARYFPSMESVPTRAVSMGIDTILAAKRILLLASGADKAEAVAAALCGPIDETVPASVLRQHSQVTYIIDEDAAGQLQASTGRRTGATASPTGY
jgi:glucosamine-6-phosphate deaminase